MAVLERTQLLGSADGEMPPRPPFRFTVQQYRRMAEMGILTEDDRVELLEGWIIPKVTHNPPHDATIDLAAETLSQHLPKGWRIRVQSAINTADSEPEPDIAVVRGPALRYARFHPRPKDIGLLIEVAEASLLQDRVLKGRLYARARIPVYWIINLIDEVIEVYTQPKGGKNAGYRRRQDYGRGVTLPLIFDGKKAARIPVRDLMVLPGDKAAGPVS